MPFSKNPGRCRNSERPAGPSRLANPYRATPAGGFIRWRSVPGAGSCIGLRAWRMRCSGMRLRRCTCISHGGCQLVAGCPASRGHLSRLKWRSRMGRPGARLMCLVVAGFGVDGDSGPSSSAQPTTAPPARRHLPGIVIKPGQRSSRKANIKQGAKAVRVTPDSGRTTPSSTSRTAMVQIAQLCLVAGVTARAWVCSRWPGHLARQGPPGRGARSMNGHIVVPVSSSGGGSFPPQLITGTPGGGWGGAPLGGGRRDRFGGPRGCWRGEVVRGLEEHLLQRAGQIAAPGQDRGGPPRGGGEGETSGSECRNGGSVNSNRRSMACTVLVQASYVPGWRGAARR